MSVAVRLPGARVTDRADGLSPAGLIQEVVLDEPMPLQDYGCFLPEDPFTGRRQRGNPLSVAGFGAALCAGGGRCIVISGRRVPVTSGTA